MDSSLPEEEQRREKRSTKQQTLRLKAFVLDELKDEINTLRSNLQKALDDDGNAKGSALRRKRSTRLGGLASSDRLVNPYRLTGSDRIALSDIIPGVDGLTSSDRFTISGGLTSSDGLTGDNGLDNVDTWIKEKEKSAKEESRLSRLEQMYGLIRFKRSSNQLEQLKTEHGSTGLTRIKRHTEPIEDFMLHYVQGLDAERKRVARSCEYV